MIVFLKSNGISINFSTILLLASISSLDCMKRCCENLMCYYDNRACKRNGLGQMALKDLRQAMPMCTQLIYGHVGINDQYNLISLEPNVDTEEGLDYLTDVPALKELFPDITFYLSIGGDRDLDNPEKYLQVLRSAEKRSTLITSIINFATKYNFQGIDLAWQFPKERRRCDAPLPANFTGCFNLECAGALEKNPNGGGREPDTFYVDRQRVRNNFSQFLKELSKETSSVGLEVMLTILPYVNIEFIEVNRIKNYVDFVHLMAYDYENPYYNPKETHFWSTFRFQDDACDPKRNHLNIEKQVRSWLKKGMDSKQIILGVPAFGRTWKIPKAGYSGPIKASIKADGPGPAGKYTKQDGKLSYYEICYLLLQKINGNGSSVQLKEYILSLGTAAFKAPTKSEYGIWLAFDNLHYIIERVKYAQEIELAGLAVMDLSLDDFRGACKVQPFPVLRTVKSYL